MLSNEEKLLEFHKSIERELEGQIAQIDADVDKYRQSQTQKIEEETAADCERSILKATAKINLEFTTERAHALSELKRKLLLKRDEYANMVFEDVARRLRDFAAGPEYAGFLRGKLRAAKDEYRLRQPVVSVRKEDLALKDVFEEVLPGCTLKTAANIAIGGFLIEDAGKSYVINESLDNALEEQKEWFFSNSGLRITL